jgi:hypothetical protein
MRKWVVLLAGAEEGLVSSALPTIAFRTGALIYLGRSLTFVRVLSLESLPVVVLEGGMSSAMSGEAALG